MEYRLEHKGYAALTAETATGYSGHVTNLAAGACIAAGDSLDEVENLLREGIDIHIEGLDQAERLPPMPTHPVDRISGILDGAFEGEVDEYIEEIRGR